MVIVNDAFWSAWGNGRTGTLGPIDDSIMKEVRDRTSSRLRDDFREFRTQYLADPSHSADAERHARYEVDFMRELRAAEAMMQAIQKGNPAECPVQAACGPLMLERWRQIPGAAGLVDAVDALSRVSPELRRYLSDLGPYYVMIHDLKRYEDAYTGLERMASEKEKNAEAVTMLVEAYLAQANELVEAQLLDRALPLLEKAVGYERDQSMPLLVDVATRQARTLYDAEKAQEVIDLLERLSKRYAITDSEFKAELSRGYFKRGLQRNNAGNDNKGALSDFRRALEINPDNEQVKQNMLTLIMNNAAAAVRANRSKEAYDLVKEALSANELGGVLAAFDILGDLGNRGFNPYAALAQGRFAEYRELISVVFFGYAIDRANAAINGVRYSSYKRGACSELRAARKDLQIALAFAPENEPTFRIRVQTQLNSINNAIAQIGC
jgi:tetratricopeptide (TPR) repeat protein